jgi:hypothetical protein
MLTFTDLVTIAQETSGATDSTNTTAFKRDINTGAARFMAVFSRPKNRQSRFADLTASQQYYQLPEDSVRPSQVIVNTGLTWRPMEEVADEFAWRLLNQYPITGIPTHFFVRGGDEIGLYPTPSSTISAGLELVFEPRHVLLSQDDFSSGSVTATIGDATITHSAAGFTAAMVGRYFTNTDGTDGNWYRIQSFTDSSTLKLENVYQGAVSGSTSSFKIGQAVNIPEEYQEAPVDYAMHRYFLRRGDRNAAKDFKELFEAALEAAEQLYSQSSSNQIVYSSRHVRVYNPLLMTPTIDT